MGKRERRKIERNLPSVGTNLMGKFKRKIYKAQIVCDETRKSGKAIKYAGRIYSSMTAAAEAITKQPTNGWRFWKIKKD